jgi:hypothetical protein
MSPKRCRSAEIMRDHTGAAKTPMLQQRREHPVLHAERNVLASSLVGLAVAQKVIHEDEMMTSELACNPAPDERRERRAMHQHNRWSVAEHLVRDSLPVEAERLCEPPGIGHDFQNALSPELAAAGRSDCKF